MQLAKELGITDYPSPAGGCLLTEEVFARRLKDLLCQDNVTRERIEMLKFGRHFRLTPNAKAIVGRNKTENQALRKLAGRDDVIFQCQSIPGPVVILCGDCNAELIKTAAELAAAYSDSKICDSVAVRARKGEEETVLQVETPEKSFFRQYMV